MTPIKHTFRLWRKNAAVTLMAVLAMAFGIGLVSTQFSLMNGVILRGLPFEDAERLVYLERLNPQTRLSVALPLDEFTHFRDRQQSFENLGAFETEHKTVSSQDRLPQRYRAAVVTANLHSLLRVQPEFGRGFQPSDSQAGAARVILLSHSIWQRDFDGSRAALGRTVRLDGESAVIIGVMPPEFHFPEDQDLWVNLWESASGPEVEVFGKLKRDITATEAQAEFDLLTAQLKTPETIRDTAGAAAGYLTRIVPFVSHYTGEEGDIAFFTMLAMGVGVLLLACANVANLTLALASRRERELSIRAAVGATRAQLIRQMLMESTLLAGLGALGGGAITLWCSGLINRQIATAEAPFWYRAVVDWRVFVFMSALTLLAGLATGLVPALRASRCDINPMLQAHGAGASGLRPGRLARWLVTLQVTIACALLGVTGILTKSVVRAQSLELTFDPASYLAVPIQLPDAQFPAATDRLRFFDDLRTELGELPGVDRVVLSSRHPASRGAAARIEIQGQPAKAESDLPLTLIEAVDSTYFETMNIPVLQGRAFAVSDRRGTAPVAIVTQSFVRNTWPNENPLGKQLRLQREDWATVIGVVPDAPRLGSARAERFPRIYFAHAQQAWERMVVLIRARQDSTDQALAIRRIVDRLAPNLAVERVESLSESLTEALKIPHLISAIFLGAGAAAIFLAALGIFGVVSFSVIQRTRDFAIRRALGAQRRQIFAMVLRRSVIHLLLGLGLGSALAFALGKPLASELIGVAAFDPQISLLIAGCVTLVVLVAIILPARRATKVDPMVALRCE
jgi:putative ABC transport system permease protein